MIQSKHQFLTSACIYWEESNPGHVITLSPVMNKYMCNEQPHATKEITPYRHIKGPSLWGSIKRDMLQEEKVAMQASKLLQIEKSAQLTQTWSVTTQWSWCLRFDWSKVLPLLVTVARFDKLDLRHLVTLVLFSWMLQCWLNQVSQYPNAVTICFCWPTHLTPALSRFKHHPLSVKTSPNPSTDTCTDN